VTSSPGVARPAGAFLRPFGAAGAGDLGGRAFRDLSKGEKQRVLLARLLVTDADLVLLDEPTAPMDARGEREALRRLSEMACERRKAVVVVSHAPRVVSEHATRVLLLDRDDALVLHGSPAEVMAHDAYRRELGQAEARDGG
jgi:zinc transport system ATP-binding protein